MRSFLGVLLILAGAALLATWVVVWYPDPEIEETGGLGRLPTEEEMREYRMNLLKRRLVLYGIPGAGVGLAALGAILFAGGRQARSATTGPA